MKKLLVAIFFLVIVTTTVMASPVDSYRLRKANSYILNGQAEQAEAIYNDLHLNKPYMPYNYGWLNYVKGDT